VPVKNSSTVSHRVVNAISSDGMKELKMTGRGFYRKWVKRHFVSYLS